MTAYPQAGSVVSRADQRAGLGWRLQVVRAAIWEAAASGDRYSRVLLDAHDDSEDTFAGLLSGPGVSLSLAGSVVVADQDLARSVLEDSDWGTANAQGDPPLQQAMRLPGAGLDAAVAPRPTGADGSAGPNRPVLDLGGARGRTVIEECVVEAFGREITEGRRADGTIDLLAPCRLAAARASAAAVGIDPDLFASVLPDLAPALDALMTPQHLDTAWGLLRALSHLRVLMRDAQVDPDAHPGSTAALVVWAALAEVAALRTVSAALGDRSGPLVEGADHEAEAAARDLLRETPPMALHARVVHEDTRLGGLDVAAGDQAVLLDGGSGTGSGLMVAAGGPWADVARQLPGFAATVSRTVARSVGTGARLRTVRARRVPVTRRWAVAELEERSGTA